MAAPSRCVLDASASASRLDVSRRYIDTVLPAGGGGKRARTVACRRGAPGSTERVDAEAMQGDADTTQGRSVRVPAYARRHVVPAVRHGLRARAPGDAGRA